MAKPERDQEICDLYMKGVKVKDIAGRFTISRGRVHQIVHKNNLTPKDRHVEPSDRDEFLGINISDADKIALRREAKRRGLSMSAITADLIRDMLASLQGQAV